MKQSSQAGCFEGYSSDARLKACSTGTAICDRKSQRGRRQRGGGGGAEGYMGAGLTAMTSMCHDGVTLH